jgi:3-polyprenyl-4-hydroxybenzoate decarboxylase
MCSKIGIDATLKMKEEGRNRPIAKIVKPKENILKHVVENWNKYGLP